MNRTAAFLALSGILALGIAGATVVALFKPESFGALATLVTGVAVSLTGTAVTLYGLGKANEKIERVEKQTNGALSMRDKKLDALKHAASAAGVDVKTLMERVEDDHDKQRQHL